MTRRQQAERLIEDPEVAAIRNKVNIKDQNSVFEYLEILVAKGVLVKVTSNGYVAAYQKTRLGNHYFRICTEKGI
jgi:Fe2+ or Zn2+ uptake regulation protein